MTRTVDEAGMRLPFNIKFCTYDEKRKVKCGKLLSFSQCLRVKPPGKTESDDIITFTTPDKPYPMSVHLFLITEINGKAI